MEAYSILWFLVAIISLIPIVIFGVSYQRVRSAKLLLVTLAFGLFFVKGISLVVWLALGNGDIPEEIWLSIAAILDIIIITLFSLPLLQRPESKEQGD